MSYSSEPRAFTRVELDQAGGMMILHRHRWRIVSSMRIRDISFDDVGNPYTRYLRVCDACGKITSKRVAGYWLLEELRDDEQEPE